MTDIMQLGNNSGAQLKTYIDRIEALQHEKDETAEVIRSIFTEAKSSGFDVPTLRAILRIRKMDPQTRAEREAYLDAYLTALGGEV